MGVAPAMSEHVAADVDLLLADRPDLAELSGEQIAPIEARTAGWPDSWRDIARSLFVTLVSRADALAPVAAAELAVELMLGLAADLGGSQPYINQGADIQRSGMAARVIALLGQQRQDYDRVAQLVGMSVRHVRRIEARWLRAERAKRQRTLELE
ncbi:hypothetical protein OPEN69S_02028 [Ottowia pentelensis]